MSDVFIHPDRKVPAIRPLKAWHHMQKLIADKEDTEQVFHIIESLNGGSLQRNFRDFLASGQGRQLLARREYLPPLLDDHSWMAKLPEGSVGRTYVDFMEREGLTAQGLVDESERLPSAANDFDDDLAWFGKRLRDTHDLYHVLTGYGRDALGEACLLAFSYSQTPGRGILFIAYMGARHLSKQLPVEARVMDCLWEGKRNGRRAARIAHQDIVDLLPRPLEDVRRELSIEPPRLYQAALGICKAASIDLAPPAEAAA